LGALRIPDPATAGDFCRRFEAEAQLLALMDAINDPRVKVWKQQPLRFHDLAKIDADGTVTPTFDECKQGMDMSYKGEWGFHPLVASLANTKEVLYLANRPGNRPSHEGADVLLDKAVELCRLGGFLKMLLRGDTDFTQTWKLDDWDAAGDVTFIFGVKAMPNLVSLAEALPDSAWQRLQRAPRAISPRTSRSESFGSVSTRTWCCNANMWPSSSTAPATASVTTALSSCARTS
jgi:hypothetical protein